MAVELLTARTKPHTVAHALAGRGEVQWDKALQTTPGFVQEAAYRGHRGAKRALAREAAILADPLRTPNIGPLLPDTPILNGLSGNPLPQEDIAPTVKPKRTPEEVAAQWDGVAQTNFPFLLKAADKNPHAAAALARWEERQQTAPQVEDIPIAEARTVFPTETDRVHGVIINKLPSGSLRRDAEPKTEGTPEFTKPERYKLVEAAFNGYILERMLEGDKTDVRQQLTTLARQHSSANPRFFKPEGYNHGETPVSDATLQRYLDDMRYIGIRQAQFGRMSKEVVEITFALVKDPRVIRTIKNIFATSQTAEEAGLAIKKLNQRRETK
jgi:hypothetical protein